MPQSATMHQQVKKELDASKFPWRRSRNDVDIAASVVTVPHPLPSPQVEPWHPVRQTSQVATIPTMSQQMAPTAWHLPTFPPLGPMQLQQPPLLDFPPTAPMSQPSFDVPMMPPAPLVPSTLAPPTMIMPPSQLPALPVPASLPFLLLPPPSSFTPLGIPQVVGIGNDPGGPMQGREAAASPPLGTSPSILLASSIGSSAP